MYQNISPISGRGRPLEKWAWRQVNFSAKVAFSYTCMHFVNNGALYTNCACVISVFYPVYHNVVKRAVPVVLPMGGN